MKTFDIHLQGTRQYECVKDVVSFIAEDATGSFGLMAGHSRFMTALGFGMTRFRTQDDEWEYLALPGALLYFDNNSLFINTRHYIRSRDYAVLGGRVQEQLLREEAKLKTLKHSLHQMDEEMLKRMWELRRSENVSL